MIIRDLSVVDDASLPGTLLTADLDCVTSTPADIAAWLKGCSTKSLPAVAIGGETHFPHSYWLTRALAAYRKVRFSIDDRAQIDLWFIRQATIAYDWLSSWSWSASVYVKTGSSWSYKRRSVQG
jgi:hypothetical protein